MDMIPTSGISIDVAASGIQESTLTHSEASETAVISLAVELGSPTNSATMSTQKATSAVSKKTSMKDSEAEAPSFVGPGSR